MTPCVEINGLYREQQIDLRVIDRRFQLPQPSGTPLEKKVMASGATSAGALASEKKLRTLIPRAVFTWVFGIAAGGILAGFLVIPLIKLKQTSFFTFRYQHAVYSPGFWVV